jgi:Tfp pilus assembly protein FimT
MKKLMLLVAPLAMLALAAIPAIAQVSQESEQEAESGDLDQSLTVTSEGATATSVWASRVLVTPATPRT